MSSVISFKSQSYHQTFHSRLQSSLEVDEAIYFFDFIINSKVLYLKMLNTRLKQNGLWGQYLFAIFTQMHHSEDPLFQILFNQLADARLILKAEQPFFRVISANNIWLERLGMMNASVAGSPFADLSGYLKLLYPEIVWENEFQSVIENREPRSFPPVVSTVNDDNDSDWVKLEIMPIKDASGKSTDYLMCTLLDATPTVTGQKALLQARKTEQMLLSEQFNLNNERELNEALAASNEELMAANEELLTIKDDLESVHTLLKESESRFRSLFEQSPVGMCFLRGEELIIELANPNILKIWGRTAEEVIGKPHHLARPELDNQPMGKWLKEVYDTGRDRVNNELKVFLYDNGKLREAYVHSVYHPLKDQQGKVTGLLIIISETTNWVSARKQMERTQEQLAMAVQSAELGTWYLNLEDGEFIPSPRFKELYGFNADEPVTMEAAFNSISIDYRAEVKQAVEKAIYSGESFELEYPLYEGTDGQLRWLRATGRAYQAMPDSPGHFSGTVLDITARKQEEIRKNDFIAIVSHELKTPLTSLKGYLQLMRAKSGTGDEFSFMRNTTEKSLSQIDKMHALIKGFLDVARLESAKLVLNPQEFSLDELIREAVEDAALLSQTHQVISIPCQRVDVLADKEKIAQVLGNLLSNAIKYSPLGREVEVRCLTRTSEVEVAVSDQGMGIKKPELDKIFSRFYRVETKHTQAISGFGIGLYLCAEIIRLHGGRIWVESETGKGSTFYFTLPTN